MRGGEGERGRERERRGSGFVWKLNRYLINYAKLIELEKRIMLKIERFFCGHCGLLSFVR